MNFLSIFTPARRLTHLRGSPTWPDTAQHNISPGKKSTFWLGMKIQLTSEINCFLMPKLRWLILAKKSLLLWLSTLVFARRSRFSARKSLFWWVSKTRESQFRRKSATSWAPEAPEISIHGFYYFTRKATSATQNPTLTTLILVFIWRTPNIFVVQ